MAKTTIRETKIALTMMLALTAVDWRLNQDANPGQKNTNFSQGQVNDLTRKYIIFSCVFLEWPNWLLSKFSYKEFYSLCG